MKTVRIAELKNRLSAYLREVRGGEEILVSDRETPIARLVPIRPEKRKLETIKPTRPVSHLLTIKGIKPKKDFDVLEALRWTRGDH